MDQKSSSMGVVPFTRSSLRKYWKTARQTPQLCKGYVASDESTVFTRFRREVRQSTVSKVRLNFGIIRKTEHGSWYERVIRCQHDKEKFKYYNRFTKTEDPGKYFSKYSCTLDSAIRDLRPALETLNTPIAIMFGVTKQNKWENVKTPLTKAQIAKKEKQEQLAGTKIVAGVRKRRKLSKRAKQDEKDIKRGYRIIKAREGHCVTLILFKKSGEWTAWIKDVADTETAVVPSKVYDFLSVFKIPKVRVYGKFDKEFFGQGNTCLQESLKVCGNVLDGNFLKLFEFQRWKDFDVKRKRFIELNFVSMNRMA